MNMIFLNNRKWLIILILFIIFPMKNYTQNLNLSEVDLDEFVEKLQDNKNFNNKINYIWSGMITDIQEKDGQLEVSVIRGKWLNKDELLSYQVILSIKNIDLIKLINSIGLYNNIIFIVNVIDIKSGRIPYCVPLIIKRV
jgi:hypothetical protein